MTENYLGRITLVDFCICILVISVSVSLLLKLYKRFNVLKAVIWTLYLSFMVSVTFLGREGGSVKSSIDTLFLSYERMFDIAYPRGLYEVLFNGCLFFPAGFLLNQEFKAKYVMLFILSLTLLIEIIQLLTGTGLFEICDIVDNTVGGIFGMLLAKAFIIIKRIEIYRIIVHDNEKRSK